MRTCVIGLQPCCLVGYSHLQSGTPADTQHPLPPDATGIAGKARAMLVHETLPSLLLRHNHITCRCKTFHRINGKIKSWQANHESLIVSEKTGIRQLCVQPFTSTIPAIINSQTMCDPCLIKKNNYLASILGWCFQLAKCRFYGPPWLDTAFRLLLHISCIPLTRSCEDNTLFCVSMWIF